MNNPLPPPAPPPILLGEEATPGTPRRGLLNAPPPPPSPPPTGDGVGSPRGSPRGGALAQPLPPPAPPLSSYPGSPRSMASAQSGMSEDVRELNRATKNLFNAYAKGTAAARAPRAARRKALGLSDFQALAQAAQLRVPPKDLE